jgi:hypothetical protein
MRHNPYKTRSSVLPLVSIASAALTLIGLLCLITTFSKTDSVSAPHLLLPHASASDGGQMAPSAPSAASPNWVIKHHGECCEGNLAAQGNSTYLLLPILLTGNQILRSDDNGVTWTLKYPPVNASVPYGIEGDLQAFGNNVDFFGTLLAQGVSAHSSDRGESWTVVPIPVPFPANDQSWSYLGPFSVSPAQTAPYVLAGWYRIGSVVLFSLDGGLSWPLQTPLVGDDGSGPSHVVCQQTAHAPTSPGDTRIPDQNFTNHKAGRHGTWGTDKKFYWTETSNGDVGSGSNLYVCKTDNFGVTWTGIQHPLVPGGGLGYVVTQSAFDNKGTLYVLHGDQLYVSFNQGESFAFVHTLPRFGDALLSDSGSDQFFVVNCGTIHIGLITPGTSGNDVYYLRGSHVDTATPTWDEELVDTVGSNRLDFFQIVINGNGIPTMSYTTPGTEVTTASRNAPMPVVGETSCPVLPISAVSRKMHGSLGPFDVNLPLTGPYGIECRTGGANGDFQIVITFAKNIIVGGASLTSGAGSVSNFSVSGAAVTVNLTGVTNSQKITLTLAGVTDGTNAGSVAVDMGVLLGDISGNKVVSNTDVSLAKSQVGAPVTASNFRDDVNINGIISNTDVSTTKTQVGTTIP